MCQHRCPKSFGPGGHDCASPAATRTEPFHAWWATISPPTRHDVGQPAPRLRPPSDPVAPDRHYAPSLEPGASRDNARESRVFWPWKRPQCHIAWHCPQGTINAPGQSGGVGVARDRSAALLGAWSPKSRLSLGPFKTVGSGSVACPGPGRRHVFSNADRPPGSALTTWEGLNPLPGRTC